ncbi:hypothetical protein [Bacillus cereus]|uniref:hypothetical protein n=1 Tax=Bacillus cereus TaxID=1396 RepID=UPI000BFD9CBB|nr:hypothetical protein [Bacillus cereus]PGT10185.1 hypothetical protein COD03_20760 [Bacillus cereus]
MAMHKKLNVGSILFTYHEPRYDYSNHRNGRDKYIIEFKALYIHNRRERTTGAHVPKSLIPTLAKLGIKYEANHYDNEHVCAVGCRNYIYSRFTSSMPYPSVEQIKLARQKLELELNEESASNEGVSLIEVEFVQDFKEKKMSNKDAVFSLLKPLHDYVANETYISN